MRFNELSRLREKAGGVLIALFILVGRWDASKLFGLYVSDPLEASPLELRFWIMLALVAVAFGHGSGGPAISEKSGLKAFMFYLNAFFIYFLLTALWAPDGRFAFVKAIEIVLVILATISVYKLVTGEHGATTRVWFWRFVVATTGILGLIAIFKAATEGPARLAVLGGGPNVFGRMMGLLCLASLFCWRRKGGPAFIASSVVAVVLVILSGSRGSMVAAAAAIIVFFLAERVKMQRMAAFLVGACVLGVAVFLFTPIGQKAVAVYDHRINTLLLKEGYTAGRGNLYRSAYDLGLQHPILGAGLAAFPALGRGVYPHNLFLEVFSEGGILGLLILAPPFFFLGRRCWKIRADLDGASVAALVFTLGVIQLSGDFYDSRALFVFMAMAFVPAGRAAA